MKFITSALSYSYIGFSYVYLFLFFKTKEMIALDSDVNRRFVNHLYLFIFVFVYNKEVGSRIC